MTIENIKGKHLLIDGDIIRYRCGFSAEKTHYLVTSHSYYGEPEIYDLPESYREAMLDADKVQGHTIWSRKEVQPVEFALQATKTTLEAIIAGLEPSGISLFLSGERNFRDTVAVTKKYKGNRDAMHKPKHYDAIGEYLVANYGAVYTDGYEADDRIGIELTADPENRVCVSTDKDLDQIAGWHYNWVDGNAYWITRRDGDFSLYSQILSGDPVDNIPGLSGIGPARAGTILEGAKSSTELCQRAWAEYVHHLGNSESTRDYFFEQANLVYIWRKPNDCYFAPIKLKLDGE